jgi:fructose-1,6-bisphosphatase I
MASIRGIFPFEGLQIQTQAAFDILCRRGNPRRMEGISQLSGNAIQHLLDEYARLPSRWKCDACGGTIAAAADGCLEWIWWPERGWADDPRIIHNENAAGRRPRTRPLLSIVGKPTVLTDKDGCGRVSGYSGATIIRMPLWHLTDSDGLMQLLEMVGSERFDASVVLSIIQRIHLPHFEEAQPYLKEAIDAGRIRPNLTPGFHWQGDLVEALRARSEANITRRSSGNQFVSRISTDLFAGDKGLQRVVGALAEAAGQIHHALATGAGRKTPPSSKINVHGELCEGIDLLAHEVFVRELRRSGDVGAILSEESESLLLSSRVGTRFICALDPLDGTGNAFSGLPVGSIFSIRSQQGECASDIDFLKDGHSQRAAGYFLYGPELQLVLTDGLRVDWLVRNRDTGYYEMVAENLRGKERPSFLSTNEARMALWPDWLRKWSGDCKRHEYGEVDSSRFVGTLVADVHRNLLHGGVLVVPRDSERSEGKLRLLYECAPMALILKAAGQLAVDECNEILDLVPRTLHQRCGFIAGCRDAVEGAFKAYLMRAQI